jgi:hypothetical protein
MQNLSLINIRLNYHPILSVHREEIEQKIAADKNSDMRVNQNQKGLNSTPKMQAARFSGKFIPYQTKSHIFLRVYLTTLSTATIIYHRW